jgi:hypothetical protein
MDPDFAAAISREQGISVAREVEVEIRTLTDVLSEFAPPNQQIDFLNIDVEGRDLDVLSGLDFGRWRPSVLAIEDISMALGAPNESRAYRFMIERGYRLAAHALLTSFYVSD